MEWYSEVVGLPVVSLQDGKKIGSVKDVVFCPEKKEIKAFLLERKGFLPGIRAVLARDIVNAGRDALVINDTACISDMKSLEKKGEFRDKGEIRSRRVVSRTGTDFGRVEDVLLDIKTGLVEGIKVSDGLLQDLLTGRKIIPLFGRVEFGEEYILVDNEALEEMAGTGGGIHRYLFKKQPVEKKGSD